MEFVCVCACMYVCMPSFVCVCVAVKVDGVLCDGPSPENIASTVVDCTKIESGHIGFFRVGLIPKSKVECDQIHQISLWEHINVYLFLFDDKVRIN